MSQTRDTNPGSGPAAAEGPTYKVNVLERAIAVLQAFSPAQPRMSLAEISRAAGLHRSTALRLLSTLTHSGMVIRDVDSGHYSLGYEVIAMAETARAGTGIADWARPVMKDMSDRLNETVVLSVRSGDYRVDVDQVIANQAIRRVVALGEHKPLSVGAPSLSILSSLPPAEVGAIVERLMPRTLAREPGFTLALLAERLERIGRLGYHEHLSHYGTNGTPGSAGIAAPVLGRRGEVVAAIGVSVPTGRMTEVLREKVIAEVLKGAAQVSSLLGQRGQAA